MDRRDFRQALGAFATGVTVVTTRGLDGAPLGLTANSFNSVSLDPPLVLWSLALDSANLDAFRKAGWWAVHVLSASQEALSNRFASKGIDKFAGTHWKPGREGIPLLQGCAVRFLCRTAFEYDGGDHAIFVGQVVEMESAQAAPLIFHGGRYARVMPATEKPAPVEPGDEGEFGRHFLGHLLGRARNAVFRDVRREYRQRGLRAAEYTVLVALGMGDGLSRETLVARAAKAGLALPQEPIDVMTARGLIGEENSVLHLTTEGRRLLTELIAVAQATQLKVEAVLSPEEMGMLLHLIGRVADAA